MSIADIKRIRLELRTCYERLEQAILETYPIGQEVRYEYGSGRHLIGEVTMHGYGRRIKFRNVETGKERWVQADAHYLTPLDTPKAVCS